jgi:hypothetical protein
MSAKKDRSRVIERILNFSERKLSADECPFAIYVANFSTATATCLVIKPFVFSTILMETLIEDLNLLDLFFGQVNIYFFAHHYSCKGKKMSKSMKSTQCIWQTRGFATLRVFTEKI